jgi:hypothetical protein
VGLVGGEAVSLVRAYSFQAISSTFNSLQTQQADLMRIVCLLSRNIFLFLLICIAADLKHRGYAFVAFASAGDAQDAIDNMDMNELRGRILKVSIARPTKGVTPATGNRASESCFLVYGAFANEALLSVWESEEWLKQYAKPLTGAGGEENSRD